MKGHDLAALDTVREEDKVGMYVPVLLALLCSVMFMIISLMFKYLSDENKIGFDSSTVTFNITGTVAAIVLIIGGSWYWQEVAEFDGTLFLIGFFQSLCEAVAQASIVNGLSCGPAGPVTVLGACGVVFLTIFECFRLGKIPSAMQFVGLVLGFIGMLTMSLPDEIARCF